MQFGRAQQVVFLTLSWAAVLFGADKILNRSATALHQASGQGPPQISVTFTHFCCTDCRDRVFSAAMSMSWIVTATANANDFPLGKDDILSANGVAQAAGSEPQGHATLLLDESDLATVDFVKVTARLREHGLTPTHLLLENVPHFRLTAVDPNLCCGRCEDAARKSLTVEQSEIQLEAQTNDPTLEAATIKAHWMPHFEVDRARQRVTAEYYHTADITRFRNALERAGIAPRRIEIEIVEGGS